MTYIPPDSFDAVHADAYDPRSPVEIQRERQALLARLDQINAEEARARAARPSLASLAEYLHGKFCTWNHTDGCAWHYEDEDWTKPTHTRWLTAAEGLQYFMFTEMGYRRD